MQKPKCEIRNPKWLGAVVSSLLVAGVWAADYSLDWSTIDGGGGTSTGGVYSVSGTIGQPDAGAMSGGQFNLVGGFWSVIAAVQTPGAPLLAITNTTVGTVLVSWPWPALGFVLEQTAALTGAPGSWTRTQFPYVTNQARIVVSVPATPGKTFFRLTAAPAPVITNVTPDNGPVSGGNVVTILGKYFQFGIQAKIGGRQASGITVISDSALSCVVPAAPAPDLADLLVINPDGQSCTAPKAYTYK